MNILILGGGVTAITTAITLSECRKINEIVILEATSKIGGRISPIDLNSKFFPEVDIGQHALSASYENFFALLKKINPTFQFSENEKIEIIFKMKNRSEIPFPINSMTNDFAKLKAVFSLNHLTTTEKLRLVRFLHFIKKSNPEKFDALTTKSIFTTFRQNEIVTKFWDKILRSVFNTDSEKINAVLFLTTMKKIFFGSRNSQQIILPDNSLNQIFIKPALEFLDKNKKVKIITRQKITAIDFNKNKISEVKTQKGNFHNFDYIVSTLPPDKLSNILPQNIKLTHLLKKFGYSTIQTAYVALKKNPLSHKAYLLPESKLDWIFNFGNYITIVTSNANDLFDKTNNLQIDILFELKKFFSVFSFENILDFILINKKKSTIKSDYRNMELKGQIFSPYKNLKIAGDWINTQLPATIESAVKSGIDVGKEICSRN